MHHCCLLQFSENCGPNVVNKAKCICCFFWGHLSYETAEQCVTIAKHMVIVYI